MYHKMIKGQYWVFGSRKKFQQGFLPRFKCSTRKELTAFYKQSGFNILEC